MNKIDNYVLDYTEKMGYRTGNSKENDRLVRLAQKGDNEALTQLMLINQRAVHKIAKKYVGITTFEFDDLVQEGNLSLLKAIQKFDCSSGYTFITYGMCSIERGIQNFINRSGGLIRIPAYLIEKTRNPDAKSKYKNQYLLQAQQADKVLSLDYKSSNNSNSFNADDDFSIGDGLASPINVEDECVNKTEHEYLLRMIYTCLTPVEQDVIIRRFGILNGGDLETLDSIGRRLNVTRERIRQIERTGLEKLRKQINLDEIKCELKRKLK